MELKKQKIGKQLRNRQSGEVVTVHDVDYYKNQFVIVSTVVISKLDDLDWELTNPPARFEPSLKLSENPLSIGKSIRSRATNECYLISAFVDDKIIATRSLTVDNSSEWEEIDPVSNTDYSSTQVIGYQVLGEDGITSTYLYYVTNVGGMISIYGGSKPFCRSDDPLEENLSDFRSPLDRVELTENVRRLKMVKYMPSLMKELSVRRTLERRQ